MTEQEVLFKSLERNKKIQELAYGQNRKLQKWINCLTFNFSWSHFCSECVICSHGDILNRRIGHTAIHLFSPWVHLSQPLYPLHSLVALTIALAGASQTIQRRTNFSPLIPFLRRSSTSATAPLRNFKSVGFEGPAVNVTGNTRTGFKWSTHKTGHSVSLQLLN